MGEKLTIAQIREQHPFPWQERVLSRGLVQMVDANGYEVGLFYLTGFAAIITGAIEAQTFSKGATCGT